MVPHVDEELDLLFSHGSQAVWDVFRDDPQQLDKKKRGQVGQLHQPLLISLDEHLYELALYEHRVRVEGRVHHTPHDGDDAVFKVQRLEGYDDFSDEVQEADEGPEEEVLVDHLVDDAHEVRVAVPVKGLYHGHVFTEVVLLTQAAVEQPRYNLLVLGLIITQHPL